MKVVTTYDEQASEILNDVPLFYWYSQSKHNTQGTIIPEINNGKITSATQSHRDYVWLTDGRVNYI